LIAVPVSLAILAGGAPAATSEYPNKPIRYIVATGPGGASDIIARTIGPSLSELLGVQLVIDNRSGAGNTVGAELASRATPDGYTLLSCNIASLAIGPALYKRLGYDPDRDFAVLGLIVSNPNVFSINPSVPAKTIPEFIALAKAQPGKLNYASAGIGTSPQLSMELFRTEAGINIVHIPYKGRRARAARRDSRPCRSHDFDGPGGALVRAQREDPGARRDVEAARPGPAGRADHRRVGHAELRGRLVAGFVHERGGAAGRAQPFA
jgi:tripartite-type tricarboxylate transporter receptor subunit TctC